ncbi:hypothetical protein [Nonomuraea sp. SYSU D8015]|uniref:hypothetical protein n=1 Tax=Nonomuraea sp. SYSU D8015 TaxID=2593644 RepID=UPI0016611BCF|nr:hypothetical protein [Nonomuraea sp. SYSU D8015]
MESDNRPPRHYSTGRLTARQSTIVQKWRDRLLKDKPLPGIERKSGQLRLLGLDDRPPASCSDVIATAVLTLLDEDPPTGIEIIRYTWQTIQGHKLAGQGIRVGDNIAVHKPVDFYLPATVADRYDQLSRGAAHDYHSLVQNLEEQALSMVPSTTDKHLDLRRQWVRDELGARGLPVRGAPRVPAGVLARMAIDAAKSRSVDHLLLAAVQYAKDVHTQPHRARRDMHNLRSR